MNEYGDKVSSEERDTIQSSIDKLKESLKGDNIEAIKTDTEALTQASHKLAEAMYAQAAADQATEAASGGVEPESAPTTENDETVIDVEAEEVVDNDSESSEK